MSETPITYMPELQGRLTDREIENKVTEAEKRGDFDLWKDELTNPTAPPIWEGPTLDHDTVQPPAEQLEAQPSLVDQNEAMSHSEAVAYIRTMGHALVHNAREDVLKAV